MIGIQKFRRSAADAAGAGEGSRFDASSLARRISNCIAHPLPGDSASSALGDVSGGGTASRSAAPAIPIIDYALPLVTPKFTWRDALMVQGGIWLGVVIGLAVAFLMVAGVVAMFLDWS